MSITTPPPPPAKEELPFSRDLTLRTLNKILIDLGFASTVDHATEASSLIDDLDMDSLDAIEFFNEIEAVFGVDVADRLWTHVRTIRDVVDIIMDTYRV